MKKIKILSLILTAVMSVSMLASCSGGAITPADFSSEMVKRGYEVETDTDEADDYGVFKIVEAENDYSYFEFVEFRDEETAKAGFDEVKEDAGLDTLPEGGTLEESENYITASANDVMFVLSRVGNTVLVCEGDYAYRDDILAVVDDLGYGK